MGVNPGHQKRRKENSEMKAASLFLFLGSASAAPQLSGITSFFSSLAGDEEPGEVNGDYQQVPYTVIQKFQGYEERLYPSVKYTCTEMTYNRTSEDDGGEEEGEWNIVKLITNMARKGWKSRPSSIMFKRLFRYISGVNKEQTEVEMTVPVVTTMKLLDDSKIFKQMCFYLPKEHQASPPTPVDEAVTIETKKEMTVYVHQFGGYAMKDYVWEKEAQIFAEVLNAAGVSNINFSEFFALGYDSPMKFWNRRNEVMFEVTNPNEVLV